VATALLVASAAFLAVAFILHVVSIGLVMLRLRRRPAPPAPGEREGVSLLRPVCGLDFAQDETLGSTFELHYRPLEILFCVESPDDPALPPLRALLAAHPASDARILIGSDPVSGNPKLNNLVKGWRAARYNWVIMSDSNVLLPPDYVEALMSRWQEGRTGLVSSPPAGIRPEGLWGALECAFLNGYQTRWQLAADQIGFGFAQGKTLFWRRDILEQGGGLAALGRDIAEDVASTKLVRRAGLHVRLSLRPFVQPIGRRGFAAVWQRQLRWARVRRLGFLPLFLPEILSGGAAPLLAALVLAGQGALPLSLSLPLVAGGVVLWYGWEYALARLADWPHGVRDLLAFVLRDALIPPLWLACWAGNDFAWRGNDMRASDVSAGVAPEVGPASETEIKTGDPKADRP